jgi:hypothetical protein
VQVPQVLIVVSFILGGSIDSGRGFVKKSVSPAEIRVFGHETADAI